MAMTDLERKRKSLDKKEKEATRAGDPTDELMKIPFNEYLRGEGQSSWSGVVSNLALADMPEPVFTEEMDDGWTEEMDGPWRGPVGRAERSVGVLLDAASEFALLINDYKRAAMNSAIGDLESSDLSDPKVKKLALAEIVRLNKMKDQLDKKVRREISQWKVRR